MARYQIYLNMIEFPDIVRRGRHALIMLQDAEGRFLLSEKKRYPKGIKRFVGGGLDQKEDAAAGAARELAEETGLQIKPAQLKPLAEIEAHLVDGADTRLTFTTYLFYYQLSVDQHIKAQDDIDGVAQLTEEQYYQLLHAYEQLPKTVDDTFGFAWYDYGQLYGFIHRLAINELRHP